VGRLQICCSYVDFPHLVFHLGQVAFKEKKEYISKRYNHACLVLAVHESNWHFFCFVKIRIIITTRSPEINLCAQTAEPKRKISDIKFTAFPSLQRRGILAGYYND
jgi:hypothetical protein